jgi:hypothetical protein
MNVRLDVQRVSKVAQYCFTIIDYFSHTSQREKKQSRFLLAEVGDRASGFAQDARGFFSEVDEAADESLSLPGSFRLLCLAGAGDSSTS